MGQRSAHACISRMFGNKWQTPSYVVTRLIATSWPVFAMSRNGCDADAIAQIVLCTHQFPQYGHREHTNSHTYAHTIWPLWRLCFGRRAHVPSFAIWVRSMADNICVEHVCLWVYQFTLFKFNSIGIGVNHIRTTNRVPRRPRFIARNPITLRCVRACHCSRSFIESARHKMRA